MTDVSTFGAWMKRRREELGYTEADVAVLAGCSARLIADIESGTQRPSSELTGLLASLLAGGHREVPPPSLSANGTASSYNLPVAPTVPSGTLTFLFTDIEGSTKRWGRHFETMGEIIARHDALLRVAIETQGGYVFKTVGDAFCAAFSSAWSAVSAAIEAQRRLSSEDWGAAGPIRVRMALHTGMAEERDGDYFGPSVNRVARILSAAYGGQVLLSLSTQQLICDTLPAELALDDLGEHRLKDLQRPENIFQLVAPGLEREFPPLRTLDSRPNNLSAQPTALIGRERELLLARTALLDENTRILTLTGPGGVGKTRTAVQIAADLLDEFNDGTFLVDLTPITDPELVASSVAGVLGVLEAAGRPLLQTLKDYLRDKHMLLLLDNFEQVVNAAPLLADLIACAPGLKMLVTSREGLRLRGEHELPLSPLALPDADRLPSIDQLGKVEAVQLFVERARAARPDFQLSEENSSPVVEICRRLDGLPLAIELAAARVKVFSPHVMLARMGGAGNSSPLQLLTGGARDLPARQQTLRQAIAWSYDLLDSTEQLLFRRLSILVGSWTLEAADAIASFDGNLSVDIVDGISSLVDKSLLRLADSGEDSCFLMLQTIREFGLELLMTRGEMDPMRARHAVYYIELSERVEPHLRGPRQVYWLAFLEREHDNLRAALRWSDESSNVTAGLRLAGALRHFWFARGHLSEGRRHMESVLQQSSGQRTAERAKVLTGAGRLSVMLGDYTSARSMIEEALAVYEELQDRRGIAAALNELSNVLGLQGDYTGKRGLNTQSLEIFRELGDEQGIAGSLFLLANVQSVLGEQAQARSLFDQSLGILRKLGDKRGIALSLFGLGNVDLALGDHNAARAHYREGLLVSRELGDRWSIARTLANMGEVASNLEEYGEARALYEESLSLFRELGARKGIAELLDKLGKVALLQKDYEVARRLMVEGLNAFHELGNKLGIVESLEALADLSAGGRNVSHKVRAVRLYAAAEALRGAIGTPLTPSSKVEHDRNLATVGTSLDPAAFSSAWEEGHALAMEQAIALALAEPEDD